MVKKLIAIVLLLAALYSEAQVTVNVQLPPGGLVQKDALWNLILINNGSSINDVVISLDIQDAVTGQTLQSSSSTSFILGKGVKLINIKDVQPLQYNYLAGELTGTFMPLGVYIACYRVWRNGPKGIDPLGDDCVKINISPLSPPLLNAPANNEILEKGYPQFSWLPPAPSSMFSNLNYDLLVTEVLPGQSPAEAVLYNTPVYSNYNLRIAYENYPASFSILKEGRQYAWQVIARNGLSYTAQTEVWSFSIKAPDSIKAAAPSGNYIALNGGQEQAGISYAKGEELSVKYYSFDKTHEVFVRFLSADGKEIQRIKQTISYGNNFLRFKLNKVFQKGSEYAIELKDLQSNTYGAKFIIQ